MPSFEYTAITKQGKQTKGSVDADSMRAARAKLREHGIFPTTIKEGKVTASKTEKANDVSKFLKRESVSTKELAIFTRQLSTLIGAGLPLVSALSALTEQTGSETLRRVSVEVKEAVESGISMATALGNYPKIFPRLYINMVAAGEASGLLDKVLNNLADYLEGQMVMHSKLKKALTYPIMMLILCALVVAVLMIYVVPKIVEIFEKRGQVLPLPTRIVMWSSEHFISHGWLALLIILGAIATFRWYNSTPKGKRNVDALILRLPLVGGIYKKVATSRTASTLSALLTSGVQLLTALDITKKIMANIFYEEALEQVRDGVAEGKSLASELSKTKLYPSMLSHMIAVGEKSGELESMMQRAGVAYETEVKSTLEGLSTILEPIIIMIVGALVLFIVISVMLPMADMVTMIQK